MTSREAKVQGQLQSGRPGVSGDHDPLKEDFSRVDVCQEVICKERQLCRAITTTCHPSLVLSAAWALSMSVVIFCMNETGL